MVTGVDQIGESGYYTRSSFNVHLTNTVTGERIKWYIRPGASSFNEEYIVHLVGLNERLGLKGKTLYSASKGGHGDARYSNVTKYVCTGTDVVIDCTSYSPKFNIKFTIIDENNRESTHCLPLSSPSSYSSGVIWFDESQADIALDSNKIYEIDYSVNYYAPTEDFPFSFKSIIGVVDDTYRTQVGQKISPSRYGSYDELSPYDYIKDGISFFIGDRISVRGNEYYKGVLDGKAFYIPANKVFLSDEAKLKVDSLVNSSQAVRDEFFEFAKALSHYIYYERLDNAINTVKGFSTKGISIPSWGVYDMSEYTDGTGIRFTFHNPTNKTIKYVNIGFVGYNAVDDRVGKVMSKKCIGPIDPDETASYDFEYAWFTDIVEYAKITSLSVQYKYGTTKIVSNPSSGIWSDEVHNGLSSQLDNLKSELITKE